MYLFNKHDTYLFIFLATTHQPSVVTIECRTDAIHIFGCEITFLELMKMNEPNVHTLNRVRQELRTFVTNLLCNNQPSMDEVKTI